MIYLLSGGVECQIDPEDYIKVSKYKWHVRRCKYTSYAACTVINNGTRTTMNMHACIMGTTFKTRKVQIDHIDGNGLNNKKNNLRVCTDVQNKRNKRKKDNTISKYKGVSYSYSNKKWTSKISVDNKNIHLGSYEKEVHAAIAYNNAAKEYFGDFARINNIPKEYENDIPIKQKNRKTLCWTIENGKVETFLSLSIASKKYKMPASSIAAAFCRNKDKDVVSVNGILFHRER